MSEKPPTWEIVLSVYGPVSVGNFSPLRILKGFRINDPDPFYSDIELRRQPYGIEATITAFAYTSELAHKAALLFFGQMLDTLAIKTKQSLYLSFSQQYPDFNQPNSINDYNQRRVVERDEWISAFNEAFSLNASAPTFLRALSWFRKGLYTEDPFDRFLAFWNSIEVTATKYHPKNERAKKGSKSQIWECFKVLWGECDNWPDIIKGDKSWIDENCAIRTQIAHGTVSIHIEEIEQVVKKLDKLEEVACIFLKKWKEDQLQLPAIDLLARI